MTVKLGVLTIGEAPRPDSLTADMRVTLGPGFEIVERGALDGLSDSEVASFTPDVGDYVLITLRANGTSVSLGKKKILSLMQRQINRLEQEDCVVGTLLMCTGAFPAFAHQRLLLQPQAVLYHTVVGLANGGRPASLTPLESQSEQCRRKWAEFDQPEALVIPANPYCEDPMKAVYEGAKKAREEGAAVLFMDCFGYTLAMREKAREAFGGPVVLARSMAARVLAEIVG